MPPRRRSKAESVSNLDAFTDMFIGSFNSIDRLGIDERCYVHIYKSVTELCCLMLPLLKEANICPV